MTNGNILVIFVMASLDLRLQLDLYQSDRLNLGNDRHEALPRQLKASLLIAKLDIVALQCLSKNI